MTSLKSDGTAGEFISKEEEELSYVSKPFDGVGIVSPEYSGYKNAALGVSGATSFQVEFDDYDTDELCDITKLTA